MEEAKRELLHLLERVEGRENWEGVWKDQD
jgi:hypothetical protein